MSADYEPIGREGGATGNMRTMLLFVALAFIGGAIATGWVVTRYDFFGEEEPVEEQEELAEPAAALAQRIDEQGRVAPPAETARADAAPAASETMTPERERALALRVSDLEERLSRIDVRAQAASGNAARAEGLLIAFAARRSLDTATPLGYIEGQLRLRFGDAQPRAVATIVNFANDPVTLEDLQGGLDDLAPALTSGGSEESFSEAFRREIGELFVLRREGTPSPLPEQRLVRAKRFIEVGNVEAAIAEVEKLPGEKKAADWIEKARRFAEARRALELIETAAILEPRQLRAADGTRVEQPSPLAPQQQQQQQQTAE